ncbi:inovirus-type Gp2 protein [Halomonas sp. 707B3]|uniref:YagK/YfjJ domain-containing protein n=1 Tax=Halomonas sp. 707B3 TaxID=1681043 RepID=UPI00209DB97E|nr:inovirus-type Gp2 protein [Halomonas sp. 707B3]MCP1319799.1 inovirus Gp2 family protein [Halomonas sp. 707B3]
MFHDHLLRHPDNDKLRFYWGETYQKYDISFKPGIPQIENYLASAWRTLHHCVDQQHLTFAVRMDLHFPEAMSRSPLHDNNEVLTRFFRHLRYELDRVNLKYPHNLRYIWAREQAHSDKPHYHLMLLLNKNAVDSIGYTGPSDDGSYSRDNLFHRVYRAWLKAIGFSGDDLRWGQIVHVSEHPATGRYWSGVLHRDDYMAMNDAMYMASYLCKAYTKPFCQGIKVFDCSRR